MAKHVMAMTYEPKIKAVLDGRCRQTIRQGEKVKAGDEILFHGWEGKPYRSKWNWRKRVIVRQVIPIYISDKGILLHSLNANVYPWNSVGADKLAELDYIKPPSGNELRDVLFKLNNDEPTDRPIKYQVIKW